LQVHELIIKIEEKEVVVIWSGINVEWRPSAWNFGPRGGGESICDDLVPEILGRGGGGVHL
jgi:hypothetical protein